VKRNMALRRHSKIMEELQKEHEDFLNGETYATNISAPGQEAEGDEGGGCCPFCRVKGHKTKNSQQCRFSIKPTSRYYSSDNVHVPERRNLISVLGEGEFYDFYVHRLWGTNFGV
jgi:hypothetical protein